MKALIRADLESPLHRGGQGFESPQLHFLVSEMGSQ